MFVQPYDLAPEFVRFQSLRNEHPKNEHWSYSTQLVRYITRRERSAKSCVIRRNLRQTQNYERKKEFWSSEPKTQKVKRCLNQAAVQGRVKQMQKWARLNICRRILIVRTILSTGDHDIGRTHLVEHTIDTGDHKPLRQPLRRQSFQHQEYIDEETKSMLKYGIIEPVASPWASNVVLVKKKDGSLRFCVDYTEDSTPSHTRIVTCCHWLTTAWTHWPVRRGTARWTSARDVIIIIPIAESDRDKSAFISRQGCFRFTIMPFGLTCAPSVFQHLMDVVLCGLSMSNQACLVYLDDVIVFGRTFDEQLAVLGEVFNRLQTVQMLPV